MMSWTHTTHNQQQQPFYGPLSGTTRVSRYQKKHSPTHHPDHHPADATAIKIHTGLTFLEPEYPGCPG